MAIPDFLRFDPVPVRARKDGWTAAAQRRFILLLSQGAGPSEAARHLGRSKQSAYALRGRADARGFAAAWDGAVDFAATAREAKLGSAPVLAQSGLEVILTPRFYRGRLIGFVQREDHGRALRTLKQLDTLSERVARSGRDPEDYYRALEAFDRRRGMEVD